MIIPALNAYYERLADAESTDLAPQGFSRQKIAIQIVISKDGQPQIQDARIEVDQQLRPRQLIVPGGAKPSGSGIHPCFLWDNSAYCLGYKPNDDKPERTQKCFAAFRKYHLDLVDEIDDPHFFLVCKFLQSWEPESIKDTDKATIDEIGSGFCVFRVQGETEFVHDRPSIKQWWISNLDSDKSQLTSQCLVSGQRDRIARLHQPKIKGVTGAQSSGATIVAFNFKSVESYGKEQGMNAPVSEQIAFQYTTALNRLLDSSQRIRIGDATVVYWTEKPAPAENWLGLIFGSEPTEDEETKQSLNAILTTIRQGGFPPELGEESADFYILGLSPNAARISVRFWCQSSLGNLVRNLHTHFNDLSIAHSKKEDDFPTFWQILRETARETKDIPPLLSGPLMRSVLNNIEYPQILYSSVIRRIRADRDVNYIRAAILKAFLNRNARLSNPSFLEITMALDPNRPDPAYQMGRLFAQLEKCQEDAQPGINDTIKARFFSAASATPSSVFPRIIRLNQHHVSKLDNSSRIHHERRIQEICSHFDSFPPNLTLQEQGAFALGYYHQRQDIFTKKTPDETDHFSASASSE